MNKLTLISTCLILLFFCSCKKDCQSFETYQVDFFADHEDYLLVEPVFETVTEQMLKREASKTGAKFKTVTEQVLSSDGYTKRSVSSTQEISIVVNAETNTIQNLSCHEFYDVDDFEEVEIPNIYASRTYEVVDIQGVGDDVPAQYETRTFQRLISDSQIIPLTSSRRHERITFTIPDHMTIEEYLNDQMAQQEILNCANNISYQVVE